MVTHCRTQEERLPATSLQSCVTVRTSSWAWAVDASTRSLYQSLLSLNSIHKWKLSRGPKIWGRKWRFKEAQGKQRNRMKVTLVDQHQSGREISGGKRQAKWPGLGESTHCPASREPQGWWHTTKFCNSWQSLVLLPHRSLRKIALKSIYRKNENKKSKNSRFSLSFFFFWYEQTWRKRRDLRRTAGRWCQTLAETGACCLHFSRREKQVKGSERTACCDLARRTNQVNFQSHGTGKEKKIKKKKITIKVIYWQVFCCHGFNISFPNYDICCKYNKLGEKYKNYNVNT